MYWINSRELPKMGEPPACVLGIGRKLLAVKNSMLQNVKKFSDLLACVCTVMNLPALKRQGGSFSPKWQTVLWWTEDLWTLLCAPAVCPAQQLCVRWETVGHRRLIIVRYRRQRPVRYRRQRPVRYRRQRPVRYRRQREVRYRRQISVR